jgi:hypothetical protein
MSEPSIQLKTVNADHLLITGAIATVGPASARAATRYAGRPISCYLDDAPDGDVTLWLWPTATTDADEQDRIAVGIKTSCDLEGLQLIDASGGLIAQPESLADAQKLAGRRMSARPPMTGWPRADQIKVEPSVWDDMHAAWPQLDYVAPVCVQPTSPQPLRELARPGRLNPSAFAKR